MENKPESGEDEENKAGWFLPWICLVALFGIIIVDGLMNPDMLKEDQSFWNSLFRGGDFGVWNFIVSVIIFILLLLFGALALLLSFLPDAEPKDGMQFEIDNEFDELIENAIIDEGGFFNLNRTMLALSLIIIIFAGPGAGQANVSTMELVLFWGGILSVFLFTTFIEIRNLFSWLSK